MKTSFLTTRFSVAIIVALFLLIFLPQSSYALSVGFDYPVNKPNGEGYSNGVKPGGWDGWGFLEWNGLVWHPGEDWNRGSGETDFGDPVYSIESGLILVAKDFGGNWGKVILIEHSFNNKKIWTQYAHLSEIKHKQGTFVQRGDFIGRIGNANGKWASHLHFEIRQSPVGANFWPSGFSKERVMEYYLNPTEFIKYHRPPRAVEFNLELQSPNSAKLSWTKAAGEKFQKYEIYRSQEVGGTAQEARRILLTTINNSNELEFLDKNLKSGNHYYSIAAYFENGLYAFSEEKSLLIPRQIIPIETNPAKQERPIIAGNKIFWTDYRYLGANDRNGFIYYYDLESSQLNRYSLPPGFPKYALDVVANLDFVIFRGQSLPTGDYDIFAYDINTGNLINLINDTNNVSQYYPAISLNNYAVWSDGRSGKFDIYYINLNNPESGEKVLVAASENERFPKIWGNTVVWADTRRKTKTDLYYKVITDGEEVLVAENITQVEPDTWKNYVVWAKDNNLYLYDILTKETKIIDTAQKMAWPRINDGKIVYLKDGKIALFDLASQMSELIETPNLLPQNPYYAKDMIVFAAIPESNPQSTNYDIYLINL